MNTATMKKRQHMQLRLQPERNFDTLNLDGGGGSGETGTRSVTWSPPFVDDADDAVAAAPDEHISDCSVGAPVPVSPSPSIATPTLSLPSPYYDRNPVVGFPKSPPPVLANVPLQNVYDGHDHHLMDGSKYHHYQRNHRRKLSMGGSHDDDKENIVRRQNGDHDNELLQQQLDEVLRACTDYEERHRGGKLQQQPDVESPGTPECRGGAATVTLTTTTPPQQNRIKTNGSLPRDNKKPSPAVSPTSPTKFTPASPPLSSPLSPFSPPMLSPLSTCDSVFSSNDSQANTPSATLTSPTYGNPDAPFSTATAATTNFQYDYTDDIKPDSSTDHFRGVSGLPSSPQSLSSLSLQSPSMSSTFSSQSFQSPSSPPHSVHSSFATQSPSTQSFQSLPSQSPLENVSAAAAERRRRLLVELSTLKSHLVDVHLRREEVERELTIETALLRAELETAAADARQSDEIVQELDRAAAECRALTDECTARQQEQRTAADHQLASHVRILENLRSQLEKLQLNDGGDSGPVQNGVDGDAAITKVTVDELRASIDERTELLEAEQKLFEDVEFGLLEQEAGWLVRREELHRDRAAAVAARRARRARADWIRAQLDQLRGVGQDQLRALRGEINSITLSIQQGHKKLRDLDSGETLFSNDCQQLPAIYNQNSRQPHTNEELTKYSPPSTEEWASWSADWRHRLELASSQRLADGYSSPPLGPSGAEMTSSVTTTCCSSTTAGSSGGEDDENRDGDEGGGPYGSPYETDATSQRSVVTTSTALDRGCDVTDSNVRLRPKTSPAASDVTKRPLTRYLPVRDGSGAHSTAAGTATTAGNQPVFDLRAHIESAGHQIGGSGGVTGDDAGDVGSTSTIATVDRRRLKQQQQSEQQHFWIDCTSCRGYLKKLCGAKDSRSGLRGGKWKRRWFVFDRRTRTLRYYKRRSDEPVVDDSGTAVDKKVGTPRASIRFQDIQEVYVDHTYATGGKAAAAFVVKTAGRTFRLRAATAQATRVWVDAVFTGAEGYREYQPITT